MALKKFYNAAGFFFKGLVSKFQGDIEFETTTNPEVSTEGGGFIWKLITANVAAWVLRDDTKSQVIVTANTTDDKLILGDDYLPLNFDRTTIVEITSADSPYTASWGEDINCDASSGAITINLPTSVNNSGKSLSITKNDNSGNAITYAPNGAETVNTAAALTLTTQYDSTKLLSINDANIGKR